MSAAAAAEYSVDRGSEIPKDTGAQVKRPLLLIILSIEVRRYKRYGRAGSVSAASAYYSVNRCSEIEKDTDAQVQCPLLLLLSILSDRDSESCTGRYEKIRTRKFGVR